MTSPINEEDIMKVSEIKIDESPSPKIAKRQEYLEWEEYFMGIAFLAAQRSKDPATQVGACIVNKDKHIVGIGYNGLPMHCSDDKYPWTKDSADPLENKYAYVVHAEVNAVLNKNSIDVKGCSLYVALFPCNECAKIIIQSQIREVVYFSDKHADKFSTIASKRMLDSAKITYRQFVPKHKKIVIEFDKINDN